MGEYERAGFARERLLLVMLHDLSVVMLPL
jgi:hypothetical protein